MSTSNDSPDEPGTDDVLAELERRFAQRRGPSQAARGPPSGRSAYELAAAVLHVFDPKRLQPHGEPSTREDPFTALFDASVPAVGWRHQRLRSLRPEVRREALAQLGSRDAMRQALASNPDRTNTALQVLFERWVGGEPLELERLSHAQLECLRELYDWGIERFGPLPEREHFEAARVRRAALGMFEHLVDASFTGRETELQLLRDHVGVSSPSMWARLRRFLADGPRAPLVIWGPGGTGKTALIGRFLMDHLESARAAWFPFAYLAFDSDTLDVREPFTVLVAAASQLEAQLGGTEGASRGENDARRSLLEGAFTKFREEVENYRDARGLLRQRANIPEEEVWRLAGVSRAEYRFNVSFSQLLGDIAKVVGAEQEASQVPVLLVLDTFEEVLYRTNEELRGLWGMLETVQTGFPALRVVIASRTRPRAFSVGGRRPAEHELSDLEERDALSLLRHLRVDDDEVARAIFRQVGGNPLTLRLAARVAQDEAVGAEGIRQLRTRRYFFLDVAPELIRGQLYRRVLDHIHDEDVRALAHPGMVLRRVTADLIQDVLAPICGLRGVDGTRAEALFEQLGREHSLVSLEDDTSLRYREEVRRPLLELLARDKPEEVRAIHQAVVEYYRKRDLPDPVERAEELYHFLMQGTGIDPAYVERNLAGRWLPGVESRLSSALDEIPVEQRVLLARYMSIELPPQTYQLADLANWERLVGRKALNALRHEGPREVLQLLGARKERTPESPLYAIEARALLAMGRQTDAAALLSRALEGFPTVGNLGRLAELLWIQTRAMLSLDDFENAGVTLGRLEKLATTMRSPLTRVQALTELVALEDVGSKDGREAREALAAVLSKVSERDADKERSLIRLALTRLGADYPATLGRLLPLVVHDWMFMVSRGSIDVRPALREMELVLRERGEPWMLEVARYVRVGGQSAELSRRVAQEIVGRIGAPGSGPAEVEAAITLLRAENASLREANLAGIESYRESWELDAAPEVLS
ncbi:hypothetical protein [Pyxidicoccus xibeiensis]|uniref:hypothetical protein n=1 Tax=Pyxidicoccus xibeiensis TaxID=2906759 RepID=UPI0020A78723|nr:hypothetical protein [Pyxidicoccus xibeiensis]MCP3139788.1 hypothetical protein [Pyxidicoccus xibeiensis]